MRALLERMAHRLRGRPHLYQYFTNVTWESCASCLAEHGRSAVRRSSFRAPEDGCPREILAFPVQELAWHQEPHERTKALARLEGR